MNIRAVIALLALAGCLAAVPGFAQNMSSLQGVVSDPSGAVVPAAEVSITNVATGAKSTTQSNEVGVYRFPQITPGTYTLVASFEGFAQVSMGSVQLPVSQPVTIDVQLEVGPVAEVVSVDAETAQINTVDASMGNAVGTRPILQLPIEARNVVNLLSLQPGVVFNRDNKPVQYSSGQEFDTRHGSVNGGRSDQANITLDGVDVNDQQNGYAFTSVLRTTLDSVQEFRTTTLNAGADQGRSSGAQVALVTKSGTNDVHGSGYWYHRNTKTSANDFFNNKTGIERNKLNRNLYGGSVGGPLKKNRAFFFVNYEGHKQRNEDSVVRTVPSETMRQGIFRYIKDDDSFASVFPEEIKNTYDPLGIGVSPDVLAHFNKYPMPNDDTEGDGLNRKGYRFKAPSRGDYSTLVGRLDYYVDSAAKHQLFFRGNYQDDTWNDIPQFPVEPNRYTYSEIAKGIAVGYNTTISPTLYSSLRYGYTRQGVDQIGASAVSQTGFRRIDDLRAETRSLVRSLPVHTIAEDMSWMKGGHQLKFGGVIRVIGNARLNYNRSYHSATTNSSWMRGSGDIIPGDVASHFSRNAKDAMGDLLGLVTQGTGNYIYELDGALQPEGTPTQRNFQQENYELYVMDTWKVTRGMNITAGVRWSLHPPVHETNGYQTSGVPGIGEWFDRRGTLAAQGISQGDAGLVSYYLKDSPEGRDIYPYHKKNLSPRLAIAYSPQTTDGFLGKLFGGPGKTSIRAGFGMFYDNFGQSLMRTYDSTALGLSSSLDNPSGSLDPSTAPRFTGIDDVPDSVVPEAPPGGFPQVAPEAFAITNSIDDGLRAPYSMALNFSIGRELPRNFFVEASYVGRLSRRSLATRDLAMPTNLVDPASGQDYLSAANNLFDQRDAGTAPENVTPIPWFDNMMPEAAGYFIEGTASQNMLYYAHEIFEPWGIGFGPYDYVSMLADMDLGWVLPANSAGRYSMFSSQYSALAAWSSIGHGNYHAAQFTVRKRFSDGVQFDLNYTFSKSLDLSSAAERTYYYDEFMVNSFNPQQMKSYSAYDMRHQVNTNFVMELPFGRGKRWGGNWNGAVNNILGGWQLSGMWRQTSGMVNSVGNGGIWPTNWNVPGFATQTGPTPDQGVYKNAVAPDGTSGPNVFRDPVAAVDAWSYSRAGESGQRHGIRGDGYFTIDIGVAKRFMLPMEGHSIQFRWETFNITNTPRFDIYPENFSLGQGAGFGKYTYMLTNPRVMQFALRYEF
jgi:carboxypeptidase family protein